MSEFMRVFEAKALAEALTEAGHSVSERTAQRWKKGETRPKPQDIRAIREMVWSMLPDTKKQAPPPEGDGAPAWAVQLTGLLIAEIRENRNLVRQAMEASGLTLPDAPQSLGEGELPFVPDMLGQAIRQSLAAARIDADSPPVTDRQEGQDPPVHGSRAG